MPDQKKKTINHEYLMIRNLFGPKTTGSVLSLNGEHRCYILEDAVRPRGMKLFGNTAIPDGRYEVKITQSPKYKRKLPILLDVKGFSGIRIHAGNFKEDTLGCLLPGRKRGVKKNGENAVYESRLAFDPLFNEMMELSKTGRIFINIVNDFKGGGVAV